MKQKKLTILLITISALLITGCDVEYNLTVDEESVDENFTITIPKTELDENEFQNQLNGRIRVNSDSVETYKANGNEDLNNYYINYNYTHDIENFTESKIISDCYPSATITTTTDIITLSTGPEFECFVLDGNKRLNTATVNITTKLDVKENNADEVNGDTYTWIINKDNYQNKPIYMEIDLSKRNGLLLLFNLDIVIVALVFLIPVTLIIIIMRHKKRKVNRL